jgi:hypothetical protein
MSPDLGWGVVADGGWDLLWSIGVFGLLRPLDVLDL